jgi:heat shock protein HslJ
MRIVSPIIPCLFLALLLFQATSTGETKTTSGTLTADDLKNGEYQTEFSSSGKIKLHNGLYKEKIVPDSSTELVVTLSDKMAFGDLNGDGEKDAAVILITNPGGSGTFRYLAAVINQNGSPNHVASQLLGDRIKVKSLSIRSGEITVEMITHGPSDPLCCPTLEAIHDYQLQGNKLVFAPSQGFMDRKWTLQSFGTMGSEEGLVPNTEITIEFSADGKIHGSGGCNRYFSAYEFGANGSLKIKPIGSTQMACPEEIMAQEMNYFKALQGVSAFKVKSQVLRLFYDTGDRVLNFNESITR